MRIVSKLGCREDAKERAAALTALTSFEFFDALAENLPREKQAIAVVLEMGRRLFAASIAME
jgi:hypothetical protein